MSDGQLVRIEWRNRVALLTIDNPPLNLLKAAVRAALLAAIRTAAASDPERIVITGAGKAFVAGADAREFGDAPIEPHLNDVLREILRATLDSEMFDLQLRRYRLKDPFSAWWRGPVFFWRTQRERRTRMDICHS